ncbi:microtubule associated protein-domain-containing protein [Crucibulum laeve]|uniref:Microtubule associated protein-domain-containing protein n=1 Tax=Crucibulum laeve TaxID=68775 RepID=A0A5C3LV73_9AGAR|nr:microtubule associated protein-domain-containing protein [Crucibulum laeve]
MGDITALPPTSVTLTSLLNSLHTHLQTQTQLLPTLHAQLGLPPTALEDELLALQQELMQSVEKQIETRRKQVNQWMEKCDAVENECVRYSKALGGNIKATGSSVGELRKEMVLPRRYEMVSEYQEKLRQLYHTKLEQLTTLTNRLNALSRTLGPDYFAHDIVEPTPAAGESGQYPSLNRDVTPERFSKLEKELVRGKAEVTKRLHQLSGTLVQIDWLYTELGITPPTLDDLPSSSSNSFIACVSSNVSTSSHPGDPFLASTPTPASRAISITPLLFREDILPTPEADYQRIFAKFVARMEEADDESLPETQHVPIGLENVDPTPGLLSWAAALHSSLEDTKRRRETHIQAMYDQLESLWKRLGVDEVDMDAFVEAHRGSTEETVREYEEELERMLELKRERMGTFVESAREEILKLWDDLMVGEEERADFPPFADDEFTEELLTIHEDEIRRLKEERRIKAPLLAGIKKYFEICEEEKELAAAASDQSRLLGRGPRDPGRLLREEKMRKRVSKEKPRLEQDLLASIPAWEEEARRPFLVHGESILQLLMETVSASEQENKRKPARAGSVPVRSTTPVNSTHSYVPGAKTGVVTPAVRPGSSMSHSVPNKRQKLGENNHSNGHTPNYAPAHGGRAPLGAYRCGNGVNGRSVSPTKLPSKTPGSATSSLPRPTVAMPVPRPGTQHHALGHGRVPSASVYSAGYTSTTAAGGRSISAAYGRYPSGDSTAGYGRSAGSVGSTVMKKATRARRESFKPRPSADALDMGRSVIGAGGTRWTGGFSGCVKEEDEEY